MRLLDEEVQGSIMKWHSTSRFKPVQAHNVKRFVDRKNISTRDLKTKKECCGPCITENMTNFLILTHSEIARQQEEKQRSTLWYKASSFLQQQFYSTTTMRKNGVS